MNGPDRRVSWERAAARLSQARALLADPDAPGIADFIEYLSRNELGLAFDVLTEVGVEERASQRFWSTMREAAATLELTSEDKTHGASMQTVTRRALEPDRYPCPCCGHLVFEESPGNYEICPVCFWEDDMVQLRWPDFDGGANDPSLLEAQRNYARLGAKERRCVPFVRPPKPDESLDPQWRPFDPARDTIEETVEGRDYGNTYADDLTAYYYWRDASE